MQTRKTLLLYVLLPISLSILFTCAPDAPDFNSIKVPKIDAGGKIFLPQDSTLFLGEKCYLYIKVKSGASPLNYQWKKNGITIDSSSGDTLNLTLSKESVGAYRVFVSNSFGIDSSAFYTIKDTALFSAKLLNGGKIERIGTPAQDSNLTFFVRGRGIDTVKFQWYKGDSSYHTDSLLTGKTDSILRFTPVKYIDNGYYYVVCSNRYGMQTSLVDSILIIDTIKPSIQLIQPKNNSIVSDSLVLVKAIVKDKNGIRVVIIDGDTVFSADSIFTKLVKLSIGNNSFSIKAIDKSKASNSDSLTVALTYDPAAEDILPPFIELISPANNSVLADSIIQVKVKVKDKSGISAVTIRRDTVTSTDSIYTKRIIVKKGVNTISIVASDNSNKKNTDSVIVTLTCDPNAVDNLPPIIELVAPVNNSFVVDSAVKIRVKVTDISGIGLVTVKDEAATLTDAIYEKEVTLKKGPNKFFVKAIDNSPKKNRDSLLLSLTYDPTANDTTRPTIKLQSPPNNSTVSDSFVQVKAIITDANGISLVTINGEMVTCADSVYLKTIKLALGANSFFIKAIDNSLKKNRDSLKITLTYDPTAEDNTPPIIEVLSPVNNTTTTDSVIQVKARIWDKSGIGSVTINTVAVTSTDSIYTKQIKLFKGLNTFYIKAVDNSTKKNADSTRITVTYDPTANDTLQPAITLQSPPNNSVVSDSLVQVKAIITDASGLSLVTINEQTATSSDSIYIKQVRLAKGSNSFFIKAIDNSTKKNRDSLKVTLTCDPTMEDNTPPIIEVLYPVTNTTTTDSVIQVRAKVWDRSGISSVTINTEPVTSSDSIYTKQIKLSKGSNTFFVKAVDNSTKKNADSVRVTVTYAPTYTVTYHGNGSTSGSAPVDTNHYITGATVTVKGNTGMLVKAGYSFAGWNTAADGSGTNHAPGSIFLTGPADLILYAKWTANNDTITFDANGGTGTMPPQILATGATAKLTANAFTRAGYTFAGWALTTDGAVAYADTASYTMGTANVTLYAVWTPLYTVTYNGNGNTGGTVPAAKSYIAGAAVTVAAQGDLAKTGCTFMGWNTAANGSGTNYTAGTGTFTIGSAAITLYANWADVVDIDGNGYHAVTIGTQTWLVENLKTTKCNDGTSIPLVVDNAWGYLTTPGYCWYNNDSASYKGTYGALYNWYAVNTGKLAPVGWHVATDDEWSALTTYLGGENVAGGKLKEAGLAHWITPNTGATNETGFSALPGGYRFPGGILFSNVGYNGVWWSSTEYSASSSWDRYMSFNDAIVVREANNKEGGKSVRCVKGHAVIFNSQGATVAANPTSKTVIPPATTVDTLPTPPTKTGYIFSGWFTAINGGGTEFTTGTAVTANITVYAKWNGYTYTVTFDGQGATVPPNPASKTVTSPATTIDVLPSPPAKTGYAFGGWYTTPDGSGTEFTAGTAVTANITVYAKWTANNNTITFDANGGDGTMTPQIIATNATAKLTANAFTRAGYVFAGWALTTDGAVAYADTASYTMGTANVTLFAVWIPAYTIRYIGNGNNGGTAPAAQNYIAGAKVTIAANSGNLVKTCCNFSGWSTAANGLGTNYLPGDTFTMGTTNITLYANWTVTDIDGNIYHTVTIGTQTWMVENLKTTKFNDNTAIPLVTDGTAWSNLTTPGRCWYDNDASPYNIYGVLYNWYTVNTGRLAPGGWHVATDAEWSTLTTSLGGESVAGGKLKEAGLAHWQSPNDGATNETGFSALPGGFRFYDGSFLFIRDYGYWWSSTESDVTNSWDRYMEYLDANVCRNLNDKCFGLSVRCVMGHAVIFDGQEATVPANPTSKIVIPPATSVDALPTPPTKTGYIFGGWFTSIAGGGTEFIASTVVTASITVYAKWNSYTYTVTFDGQGATVPANPTSKTVTSPATTVDALPTPPTKTGYCFDGWHTAINGGGTEFTASTVVTATITVYAKWASPVTDIDGNVYHTVRMGTQTWMVENLKTTKFNDGSAIPLITDPTTWASCTTSKSPGYCYYNNNEAAYKSTYGPLYNWYTAGTGKLAPAGWHVPTDAEWDTLQNYLIANGYNWDNTTTGNKTAKSLAAKSNWRNSSTTAGAIGNDLTQNNRSGFSALPCGTCYYDGTFHNLGDTGYWWSSTEYVESWGAWLRSLYYDYANFTKDRYPKSCGWSVRLLRD